MKRGAKKFERKLIEMGTKWMSMLGAKIQRKNGENIWRIGAPKEEKINFT